MLIHDLRKYDLIESDFISGKQRIQFIGPFYTGFILDTIKLVSKGYQSQQIKMKEFIESTGKEQSKNWSIEGFTTDESNSTELWDLDDLSGTPIVPNSFLRRKILLSEKNMQLNGQNYLYKDSILYFHDYGTGVFTVNVELDLNTQMTYKDYMDFVKALSESFAELLNPIICETVALLEECLKIKKFPMIQLKESFHAKFNGLMEGYSPFKKALWKHVVIYLEANHTIPKMRTPEYDDFVHKYDPFIWSSQEEIVNKSIDPEVFAYPGMLFSFVLYAPGAKSMKYSRVVELAEYVYAALSLLDNIQFVTLTEFSTIKEEDLTIRKLEKSINSLKEINDSLDYFFIILDNMTVQFSPQMTKIYENFKVEWYTNRLLENLKKKEKDLEEELESYLDYLTEKRQATLNRFVKLFTAFAVIGPSVQVYFYLSDRGIDVFNLNPLSYLGGIFLLLVSMIAGIMGFRFYRKF